MSDTERLTSMVAEMRAAELVRALRAAVNGSAHWRPTAQQLLRLIEAGVPPEQAKSIRWELSRLRGPLVIDQPDAEDRSLKIELLNTVEPDEDGTP